MKTFLLRSITLLLLFSLASCKPGMEVRLASASEQLPSPRFTIEEIDRRGERPRYNTVQVLDEAGTVLWHLRAEPFGDMNSVAALEYGKAPSGFVDVVAAAQLLPEKQYAIVVSGTARGELKFRASSAGLVAAVGD